MRNSPAGKKEDYSKEAIEQLNQTKERFGLHSSQLELLAQAFKQVETRSQGGFSSEGLLAFLREESRSIVRPYVEYLFEVFKNREGRVRVVEWVEGVCSFCLATEENLVKMVFAMLDTDYDQRVSKKDIIRFMGGEEDSAPLFFANDFELVEQLEADRPQEIDYDSFRKLVKKIWFLMFPLLLLQEKLQAAVGGRTFWLEIFRDKQNSEKSSRNVNTDRIAFETKKKQLQIEARVAQLKQKFEKSPFVSTLRKEEGLCSGPGELGSDWDLLLRGVPRRSRRTLSDMYVKEGQ